MLLLYPGELYRLLGASSFSSILLFLTKGVGKSAMIASSINLLGNNSKMGNQIYFKIAGKKKKIDRRVEPPDTFLEENHPMTISSKFCSY
jgi:hypothetical protein